MFKAIETVKAQAAEPNAPKGSVHVVDMKTCGQKKPSHRVEFSTDHNDFYVEIYVNPEEWNDRTGEFPGMHHEPSALE
ncbi:hypothetical protein Y1Q_0000741 [Alligator mississippiensis]|uniref:Uncharacterized protein n=1 Tax=Alligator mississippiensis TaxID=8496 RepID=A0A151MCA4_ALLMI|nr:hypothetical protein Y1Q_0000741 [Alligator mississippiensis]